MDIIKLIPTSTHKKRHKGRKFDRKRKRSQSHARYNAEKRWLINKARRVRKCNGEAAYAIWREKNGIA